VSRKINRAPVLTLWVVVVAERLGFDLEGKSGEALPEVPAAMTRLVRSLPANGLAARAYGLYEKFRPEIPAGAGGWGAKGDLDLARLKELERG
jgi:hypothetical protein